MSIDQRNAGVSIVNPGASSVTYTCDRLAVRNATDAVVNVIQSTDSPNANFTNSLELDVTTLDSSIAAGQVYTVQQRVEGLNISSLGFGKAGTRYCTISFWHKHTKTGTYCVGLTNSAGNRAYPAEYTQSVADTWEYSTISAIPVDTTGTWLMTNGIGLIVYFVVAAGTNFHGTVDTWSAANTFATANQVNALDSTSNFFRITGVQLEAGTTASDFEFLPVDVNLGRCQRYYEKTYALGTTPGTSGTGQRDQGSTDAASHFVIHDRFCVKKRTTPTITVYTNSGTSGSWNASTTGLDTTLTVVAFASLDDNKIGVYFTFGGARNFQSAWVAGFWVADAEL